MDSRTLDAIAAGLNKAAASSHVMMAPSAVPAATEAVKNELAKTEVHLANQEPWYQSRVMLGSVGTIVSSGFGIYALIAAGITDGELYAPLIVAIVGACVALYGRFVARKPIGAVIVLAAMLAALAVPGRVEAQQLCIDHAEMLEKLERRWGETPAGLGVASRTVMELLVSPEGTWTILRLYPSGRACLVGSGRDWEMLKQQLGEPS